MEISVDAHELEDLARAFLDEERRESAKRINKAITVGIDWLYGRALADAPRDTGVLAASITKDDARHGFARRVFVAGKNLPPEESGALHGWYQEFGTSRMPPQPFLLIHAPQAGDVVATALVFLSDDVLQK